MSHNIYIHTRMETAANAAMMIHIEKQLNAKRICYKLFVSLKLTLNGLEYSLKL